MAQPYQSHIDRIAKLSDEVTDRMEFHRQAHPVMKQMADPGFVHWIFERNIRDEGFLTRKWSNYEIPFLYIFENNHFYLKYHIFLPVKSGDTAKAANLIHSHNNYILSSLTAFGNGYRTLHFDKNIELHDNGTASLKVAKEFHHGNMEISMVESWEPHIVFNMDEMCTTLVLWSPEVKTITDGLRNHPLVKPFKKILLVGIHGLGLTRKLGVAPKEVWQYYVDNGQVKTIAEDDYFDFYKKQVGPEVDSMFTQAICSFMQKMNYSNADFLKEQVQKERTPATYKKWFQMMIDGETIPEVYGKEEINIPQKEMRIDEIKAVCS